MIDYTKMKEKALNNYATLYAKYKHVTDNPEYSQAIVETPFLFLRALYLSKRIDMYMDADERTKPVFKFESLQEALSTYRDTIHFDEFINDILDKAALISTADAIAQKINQYVDMSIYLGNELLIKRNEQVSEIAKDCIKSLPETANKIDDKIKLAILHDMCLCFTPEQVAALGKKGVFTKENVNALFTIGGDDKYKANIEAIMKAIGMEMATIKTAEISVKGTTFKNDDGSERQGILKELDEHIKAGKPVNITIQKYTYKPDMGKEEPAAYVIWDDKIIGNLPKEVSAEIDKDYKDNLLSATFKCVKGGGDVNYGADIILNIYANKEETKALDKEEADRNV